MTLAQPIGEAHSGTDPTWGSPTTVGVDVGSLVRNRQPAKFSHGGDRNCDGGVTPISER